MTETPREGSTDAWPSRRQFAVAGTAAVLLAVLVGLVQAGHGAAFGFDGSVHRWALDHRTPGWTQALRVLTDTGTGGPPYAVAAVAGAVATGSRSWWWRGALVGVAALAVGQAVRTVLMDLLDRPRPPRVDWATAAQGASLPSGHTTTSALAAFGLAAALLTLCHSRPARIAACALPALWACGVGLTRVYLGVHWPTDVLAGWLLATALGCLLLRPLTALLRRLSGGPTLGTVVREREQEREQEGGP